MNHELSRNRVFLLRLEKTYYDTGFFNITRDFDHLVRTDDGPVTLQLRGDRGSIKGHVNRRANKNGTARVMGGTPLRNWFRQNYAMGDTVPVRFDTSSLFIVG